MRHHLSAGQKISFYLGYFFHKVFLNWFEVERPKLGMFLYELKYSLMKFADYESQVPGPSGISQVETRFGRFKIRPGTSDMAMVSPAFERRDVGYFLKIIAGLLADGKKVLFLDIGADIGTFSVIVGNRFKGNGGLFITAFEPSASSFALLRENLKLNGLEAELVNTALWSEDGKELNFIFDPEKPGSSGLHASGERNTSQKVITATLDTVIGERIASFDAFVLKMDVEGVEEDILRGAERLIGSGKEIYLLVEDFIRPKIMDYLEETGARFITKLTPYNSFWKYEKSR